MHYNKTRYYEFEYSHLTRASENNSRYEREDIRFMKLLYFKVSPTVAYRNYLGRHIVCRLSLRGN